MKLLIDGNKVDTKEKFHKIIKDLFDFPEYYGDNLDSLWDCLYECRNKNIELSWINYSESYKSLGGYADKICILFNNAADEFDSFKFSVSHSHRSHNEDG